MSKHSWLLLVGVAVGMLSGCSSKSTESAPPPPKYPDNAAYALALATADCAKGFAEDACTTTQDKCVQNLTAYYLAMFEATYSGMSITEAEADKCIGTHAAAMADGTLSAKDQQDIDAACLYVFYGGGGANAPCSHDYDCDLPSGMRCVRSTCQKPVVVGAGKSCKAVDEICDTANFCDTGSHCVERLALNDSCTSTALCAVELRCVGGTGDAGTGTCSAKLGIGEVCVSGDNASCESGLCSFIEKTGTTEVWNCGSQRRFNPSDPLCTTARQ